MLAMNGLSSLLATIQKLYPQARVTSGYRGPNNPLTQAHPGSFHAQGNPEDPGAVDVAPIPGVDFNQYVNSIKRAGVPVAQAFDEQKHPFSWTTGPNWHIGQGQAPMQPQRKKTLADMIPKPVLDAIPVDTGIDNQQLTLGQVANPIANPGTLTAPKHKGLFPGKDLASILGILGDAMTAYGGGQPQFAPALNQRRRDEQQMGFDREKWAAELEAKRQEALAPMEVGGSIVQPPQQPGGQYQTLYTAQPPDPSSIREYQYAKEQGFGGSYTDYVQLVHPPGALTIPYGASVTGGGVGAGGKAVVRSGTDAQGRRVNQYSDGTIDYAD